MPAKTTAALLLSALLISPAAVAKEKSPEELALEGINKVLQALNLFMDSIPQYEAPEVLENGDIIIRRKRKGDDREWRPEEKSPEDGRRGGDDDDLEKTRL